MNIAELTEQMNKWGHSKVPFLFMVDFEMQKPVILKLTDVDPAQILYSINSFSNADGRVRATPVVLHKDPVSMDQYKHKFDRVYHHLTYGDSYLTNLTVKTPVRLDGTLRDIFFASRAKYKLCVDNDFLVFSPETFVRMENGRIFSYPMKGTIDASIHDARNVILNDQKELAEHVTIVDLIRNDLSLVASRVSVSRFRYIDQLRTNQKNLFQVSSEITGELAAGYLSRLGEILTALLPAGSVTGAPKPRTVEIIKEAEQEDRGYYTGVFGYFDGEKLDSGVMIRFIERNGEKYFYRSGGGITTQSVVDKEYQEIIDKVYVPVD